MPPDSRLLHRAAVACAVLLAGCTGVGPRTVARDRYDYSTSITESWKRQTLLNIVKLRYMDPPIFVDVGQIVAGYTLETGASVGGSFPSTDSFGGTTGTLAATGRFTDRPTVTYTPLTGNAFISVLMTPLPPDAIFFAMQSGQAADALLMSSVSVMNGLRNVEASIDGVSVADPKFLRVVALMRRIQQSGAVGLQVMLDERRQRTTIVSFRSADIDEETLASIRELRDLLGLDQEASEFQLVYGGIAANDREIAILSRSILGIMQMMAAHVDVPPAHISEGRASPGFASAPVAGGRIPALAIRCARDRPDDTFVAVPYHDQWFWIDDRDLRTKRAFATLMLLFSLADTHANEALPVITIPTQ
ncbi:MAG: hypothetical protein IAE82_15875 [Opitutaceae bacterium]|nr:hypothetical protein [Opitutaceae bacterium]